KQESSESKYLAMDFPNPMPLAGLAKALGIYGRVIEDPKELRQAITEAIALGKPAVLDVSIDGRL
ncbi:thiamine pyrophosphate-dependent enzyme, partial [Dehalococcoidia bacterium]|nr:thiamine pyrophosphate-dependent enzyme [Dehalococcoidia bacterium]